ncbi:1-deoxy-D-xylulose-5-phosphate reductoisomerase [Akkermansiaceae bacterium]|nr:1-deoxy-D-xylulose-5-phosphate reductoisomerase [Akkermansiaceae bacterium]MDB4319075.1 1-deoxy-D-xylulose-5-phosphate reductoisomerase [bacterium]MDB4275047.1 1-deoxy-D-xylulose-5-phosphate reductoisomerase [Akkermansiaceae bacterium]MDB4301319.1 1-deoxy-D-xylulose-5-phosphate reductoisomerase [Akkermansiaceae bacterium]MDB4454014.1 1-deoxy-D-xylulose-5-phosphate reductoisomerase [bacterium]
MRKRVVILGSTGSIGTSALTVARQIPDRMEIVGLAAGTRVKELEEQAKEFGVSQLCIADEARAGELAAAGRKVYSGEQGLTDLIEATRPDLVLVAIVGVGGLRPTLAAIELGCDIAVASKEILVMAGEVVMNAARAKGVATLPVDSEHNAIFQCLEGHCGGPEEVSRLIITASGGPFRTLPKEQLVDVRLEDALKHPTWEMGQKITIDSATLFNKGLEMIEARWLFDIPMERIDVVVHPQSIVHSMVEFIDGSILAQMSTTDMCFPIQYAVAWPERLANKLTPLDFPALARLDFEAPRVDDFPAINLARRAGEKGGTLPGVLNAANEVANEAFRSRQLSFPGIWEVVEETMTRVPHVDSQALEVVVEADLEARRIAVEILRSRS